MFSQGKKRKRSSPSDGTPKTKRFRSDKTANKNKGAKENPKDQTPRKKSKFTFKMNGKTGGGKQQIGKKKVGGFVPKKSVKAQKSAAQKKAKKK